MARRFQMPEVRGGGAMAADSRTIEMQFVPLSHDAYFWHDPGQDANAADDLVRSCVACNHGEERPVREDP